MRNEKRQNNSHCDIESPVCFCLPEPFVKFNASNLCLEKLFRRSSCSPNLSCSQPTKILDAHARQEMSRRGRRVKKTRLIVVITDTRSIYNGIKKLEVSYARSTGVNKPACHRNYCQTRIYKPILSMCVVYMDLSC